MSHTRVRAPSATIKHKLPETITKRQSRRNHRAGKPQDPNQPLLGRVRETGPHAGRVGIAERDQNAGVQRRGERQIGCRAPWIRVLIRVEHGGQHAPGTREIARGRQRLGVPGEFGKRRGHLPIVLT